jgi:outer membrane protein assembly factor BamD (BamD/ComL family)
MKFNQKLLLFVLFAMTLFSNVIFGQNKTVEIESFMKTMVERGLFNGTVLVEDNGQIIYKDTKIVCHAGGFPGYVNYFQRNPALKQTIVLLSNADCIFVPNMALAIQKILGSQPYQTPRILVGRTIARTVREKGVDEAIKLYHELKNNKQDVYRFRRDQLNRLGYELLEQNKFQKAIAIFKLNIEEYPQEGNPYDSLGEAYMKIGDKELAIKNYEKSLELNPKNQNAVEMLKKLKQ